MPNPRQLAFLALRNIHREGAFTDIALDRVLRTAQLQNVDRRLVTELVYGTVRRERTLDALINQLGKKKAHQQAPDFRTILHLGLYQLRYQQRIPPSAAVNTTVELAKDNGFKGLAGVANGLLRQYERLKSASNEPLQLPIEPVQRLGILHSFPDWIVEMWIEQLGVDETEQLCEWFNQTPTIDLRVNPLRTSVEEVETAMQKVGVEVQRMPHLPQALRLTGSTGAIQQLPGFSEGWWTVQDSSAQLVSYLLDPQPDHIVIDACAAPGGKTTHIAELMSDRGKIWACDRAASRLKRLQQNVQRLQLQSIQLYTGDSRNLSQFTNSADRVLLDAPCSGLGTLHRRPDIRWRTSKETVQELSVLQKELLAQAATWVKPGGCLVYATCTLHPQENEAIIQSFLNSHPHWQIEPPPPDSLLTPFSTPQGWLKVLPHRHHMDGFFMVKLRLGQNHKE
ncbi:16S rRNA (cytosine(967)-C(5))-methyltransferase [Coleofasciculus sp. LEGE 07081]|uniref:16S rRNA (cytosine(967)-C(5))-methyltransferase n=1 Tax=unclassified Coleofasciculus TaxID=2692782 RepID=UPI00187E4A26|nr:16S rRNA (cytosine(967)-C(5))-methyltransferase [Coleofasciculus sp. LEGE 07081]MBE9129968.1 16S rRNA (cytosine(967)-C(5))-methyltransferase [Coleofasciculus sp. LEGE 07081]MBE9152362.1 16S rRNA (cytosine(967)-C(5))-methyltransferase [Coleofasciculus sp. LEGE 07092]